MRNKVILTQEQVYKGNLILVNADCPIHFRKLDQEVLIPAAASALSACLKIEAANALQHTLLEIGADKEIAAVSGYRSEAEQINIYQESLAENGAEFTQQFVAQPNCSEHQTGLAIDLGLQQEEIDFICPDFPHEGICESFRETSVKYGFIERYQNRKESVTGIAQEPWHFRYVGYPHSEIMRKNNMALEEYIAYVKAFVYDPEDFSGMLAIEEKEKTIYVAYAALNHAEEIIVTIPEHDVCQISGNNVDGFILTLWRYHHE